MCKTARKKKYTVLCSPTGGLVNYLDRTHMKQDVIGRYYFPDPQLLLCGILPSFILAQSLVSRSPDQN